MMRDRTFSETEARNLAVEAAQEALARFAVTHPLPTSVTLEQAAEMLDCSTRTVGRMGLPRLKEGKIPYSAILEKLDAKRSKAG